MNEEIDRACEMLAEIDRACEMLAKTGAYVAYWQGRATALRIIVENGMEYTAHGIRYTRSGIITITDIVRVLIAHTMHYTTGRDRMWADYCRLCGIPQTTFAGYRQLPALTPAMLA